MKKLSSFLLLLLFACSGFAQNSVRPIDLVRDAQAAGRQFQAYDLLHAHRSQAPARGAQLESYQMLELRESVLEQLRREAPEQFSLVLPAAFRSKPLRIQLVKVNPFGPDFKVVRASNRRTAAVELGLHYRGIVEGSNSFAALSIFPNEVMGLLGTSAEGNIVLGKLKENTQERYILYPDRKIQPGFNLDCATEDDGRPYSPEKLKWKQATRSPNDCVGLYYEVDHDIYNDKGGTQGATNYVTGIHNQVATLYANESISTFITEMVVWDTPSPFSSSFSGGMLNDFQAWHDNSSWNGNFGQLLSYQASGGVAATINGFCRSNRDLSLCFSSINSFYNTVPTYSWTVMVVTHEFGHLFGSRHTHACVWNGNGTAIDGCAGSTEGFCSLPGIPSNGGTIMSYCHLTGAGINFNNGFGPQPGNVIRNETDNAGCTYSCTPTCDDGLQNGNETGVDCGGPDCPACPTCFDGIENGQELDVDCGGPDCPACPCEQDLELVIVLDNYPGETTWEITDAGGDVWAQGGPYGNFSPGTAVTEAICLPDGCYDFTIFDSYGDGICCAYGNGSYELSNAQDGQVYASGGQFGSSETTPFCATGPSCTDGIQNGDETGIDCGGPDCPACPCNGTGLDLTINFDNLPEQVSWEFVSSNGTIIAEGGPYADATPGSTVVEEICAPDGCFDLIMYDSGNNGLCCRFGNGNYQLTDENGNVLASGASYGSSETTEVCLDSGTGPTCSDGIQNGNETGVDCGGSNCPPCPSCNDGVQNGDETGVDCGGPDCPACPTCNDGIQNGDETGVDCGGPDCPPCSAPANCNDGIQNGDETGVDCGGPDCPPCPTCNDGIQNGEETDVDCGGPDCPACPTCDDGIQNGEETDVDCGGPDCPACPTCDDGIQNGEETDVDCGGPDCPACPTCDDGIQNGDETGVDCGGVDCVPCGTGCDVEVDLTLNFDLLPEQTSWEIVDVAGTIYGSGGPYIGESAYSQVVETVCLPAGCFTLILYDDGGNGMCCRFGQGNYELTDENGQVLASGGEFDSEESTLFCVGSSLESNSLSPQDRPELLLFPNPTQGRATVALPQEIPESSVLRATNLMGETVFQTALPTGNIRYQLDTQTWPAGIYTVEVLLSGERLSARLVVARR